MNDKFKFWGWYLQFDGGIALRNYFTHISCLCTLTFCVTLVSDFNLKDSIVRSPCFPTFWNANWTIVLWWESCTKNCTFLTWANLFSHWVQLCIIVVRVGEFTFHSCLDVWIGLLNCTRYVNGSLVKSTNRPNRIHWKLNDLTMAFRVSNQPWLADWLILYSWKLWRLIHLVFNEF